jgi:hypothetical protein
VKLDSFIFAALTAAAMSVCILQASATAQEGESDAPEIDFFRFDRWVGDEIVDTGTQIFELKQGVQAFEFPSTAGGQLEILVFVGVFPLENAEVFGNDLWFKVYSPGGATVYAKKTADDEKWFLATGIVGVMAETPIRPADTIEYEFYVKSDGEWIAKSWVQIGVGSWSYVEYNSQPAMLFQPPGAYSEEVWDDFMSYIWLKIADSPETGTVYVFPHFVGEEWMMKSCGKEFFAVATEVDPSVDPDDPYNWKAVEGRSGG